MAKGIDRDGRREARWRRAIREQGRSGLSIREFCRRGRLPESAFYFWRRELERREAEQERRRKAEGATRRADQAAAPAFVAVRVEPQGQPVPGGHIEIVLTGGERVHVVAPVDREALVDVLLAVSDVERAVLRGDGLAAGAHAAKEARPC